MLCESDHYVPESADLTLDLNGQECKSVGSQKSTSTAVENCAGTGPMCPISETSVPSSRKPLPLLTYCAEDTLASLFPSPGSERARMMTATSGLKLYELFADSEGWETSRLGACLKMLLGTSLWASTASFLTWKELVTPAGRSVFLLEPSGHDPYDTESGFWPTPNATAYKGGRLTPRGGVSNPMKNNWQDFCSLVLGHRYPSPELTERVMGFPPKWSGTGR